MSFPSRAEETSFMEGFEHAERPQGWEQLTLRCERGGGADYITIRDADGPVVTAYREAIDACVVVLRLERL